jgi:hypothetical protein
MWRMEELRKNVAIARGFVPMTAAEQASLVAKAAPHAADGRHERFKSTTDFEGPHHKQQHATPAA